MSSVSVKIHGPAGTIVLERPSSGNALDRRLIESIAQALDDLHQQKSVRAVILTGAGDTFCSGLDLHEMRATAAREPSEALPAWHEDWNRLRDLYEQMLRFPVPLIAAVDGAAHGAGLGLALASDMVICSDRSTFAVPAVRRGLVGGAMAPLLVFRVGGAAAASLMFTGQPIDAAEAYRIGIVRSIVPSEQIWVRASGWAQQIAEAPAEAIRMTKRLLNETIGEALVTQLSVGAAMGATSCTTDAAAEGLAAAAENRPPRWP